MTLSQEDGRLYYRLWLPLLDFVNRKYRISSKLKNIAASKGLNPSEVKKVADRLWSDVTAIATGCCLTPFNRRIIYANT